MKKIVGSIRSISDFFKSKLIYHKNIVKLRENIDVGKGKHFMLIGSAPSANLIDMDILNKKNIDIGFVNLSYRAFDQGFKNAIHFVSDEDCYSSYSPEFLKVDFNKRFYRSEFFCDEAFLIHSRKGGILKRGFQDNIEYGLGNDSNVMLFAVQVLYYMGYDVVNVIGCDLDYDTKQCYSYSLSEYDVLHDESDITTEKRKAMKNANAEFEKARVVFELNGRLIRNCSPTGNLNSIKRCDLELVLKEVGWR